MITFGIVLLIFGFLFGAHILFTFGIILLVVGGGLAIAGSTGRSIGRRRHYY